MFKQNSIDLSAIKKAPKGFTGHFGGYALAILR
jgi:hypothetical protein